MTFRRPFMQTACAAMLALVAAAPACAAPAVATQSAGPSADPATPPGPSRRPHRHAHVHHRAADRATASLQPLPPAAPVDRPGTGPAPVPNLGVTPPVDNARQEQTEVQPSVFQLHYPSQGEGYVTGSSPQAMDDRNAAKATGVELTIPLKQ
jgi:hypothetical protein